MAQKGGFGKVDCKIIRDSTLTPESRLIYTILATYSDKNRESYPSIDQLIRDTGMSKDRFYRHMKILEEKGIVKKSYAKTGQGNFDRRLIYKLRDFQNENKDS